MFFPSFYLTTGLHIRSSASDYGLRKIYSAKINSPSFSSSVSAEEKGWVRQEQTTCFYWSHLKFKFDHTLHQWRCPEIAYRVSETLQAMKTVPPVKGKT